MQLAELMDSVQYITDHQGKKKGVLLDLDVWQGLIELVAQTTTDETAASPDEAQAAIEEIEPIADTAREAAMLREEAAFRRLHPSLYKEYAGEYVAIHNEQLIDHDLDQVLLYRRMRQQHPGEFVWIAPVKESPDEILVFRSPRFLNGHA
ncbi:MAG: hypothetical protein R3A44_35755 [Caldilineaceae bacterium]